MAAAVERICVVIGRTRHKMIQAEIREAHRRGARLIELRLDFLAKQPDFKRILISKPCPMVATVRRLEDGGRWSGTEAERRTLLRQAIVAGFDWVDLETDVANEIHRFRNVKRIISYHNLREMPENLERIYEDMCGQDADVVKIAVCAQRPQDNLRVLDLVRKQHRPTIAVCLGDLGFPSRILGGKFGAPFAYAAFNKERRIALNIPSFEEMKNVYHYHEINAGTEIYGIIGDPVSHSLSPLLHNATFRHLGINAVYVPFRVPRGGVPLFLQTFDEVPVWGYSVTIPHKEAAVVGAKEAEQAAIAIGAANTLVRQTHGFKAFNTDYLAARDSLAAFMPPDANGQPSPLDGQVVLILGAGGVARAVAYALHREGALVTVANRTLDKAQKLAGEVGCRFVVWDARNSVQASILINCTSVGMHPDVDDMPIHHSFLKPEMIVFDTIYTPETTMLIREAQDRGCHTLSGLDMFVRQAELQFQLFTGKTPPPDLMRSVAKRALSPVSLPEDDA
jgi:3-dehydroquinate dehydratase/shikimate dehydrogenase